MSQKNKKKNKKSNNNVSKTKSLNFKFSLSDLAIVGAATAAAIQKIHNFVEQTEVLTKSLNIGVADAQKWDFVAKQSGVSTEAIGDAIRLSGGSENFERTVVALQEITDPYKRIAEAQKVFGEQTKALLPLINREQDSLKQIENTFDNMNIAIGEDGFSALSEMNSQLKTFSAIFNAMLANFAAQLLPSFKQFNQYLEQNSQGVQMFAQLAGSALNLILQGFLAVSGIISSISGTIGTITGKILSIGTTLQTVVLNLQTSFLKAFNFIRDSWSSLCEGLTSGILKAVEVIVSVLNPVLGIINTIVSTVNTITGNGGGGIASVVKNTVSNINQGNTFNNNSSRSVTTTNNNRTVNFYGNIGSQTGNRLLDDLLKTSGNVAL